MYISKTLSILYVEHTSVLIIKLLFNRE